MENEKVFSDWGREALELCEDILEALPELPERAEEFADSVEEKTLQIKKWAEIDAVTDGQLIALRNMKKGVYKWIR